MEFEEKYGFAGWQNNIRLSNGKIELVITTETFSRNLKKN
jgi:hypothetical protein